MQPCTFRPKISKVTTDEEDKMRTKIGGLKNFVKNMKDQQILHYSLKKNEGSDLKKTPRSKKIVKLNE